MPEPADRDAGLTVLDVEAQIRRNPQMYFRAGAYNEEELPMQFGLEALLCGCSEVVAERMGSWWIVGGNRDWLPPPVDRETFMRLLPFPEGGPNAYRSGVIARVCARAVATFGPAGVEVVKGELDEHVRERLTARGLVRSVAFR